MQGKKKRYVLFTIIYSLILVVIFIPKREIDVLEIKNEGAFTISIVHWSLYTRRCVEQLAAPMGPKVKFGCQGFYFYSLIFRGIFHFVQCVSL